MMAFKYQQLEELTIDQLKQAYDLSANNTVVGLGFYREEIARREADALNTRLSALTHQMRNMTIVIVALTIINTALVAVSIWQ
jgi:hypothetical protein